MKIAKVTSCRHGFGVGDKIIFNYSQQEILGLNPKTMHNEVFIVSTVDTVTINFRTLTVFEMVIYNLKRLWWEGFNDLVASKTFKVGNPVV